MSKFPLYKSIPSLITISSFMFGFNAIRLAILGETEKAIIFIIIAAILDLFDGRFARLLNANSKFGAELDSLSDLVCFGIATSFIVLYSQNPYDKGLIYATCFFSITAMLRLARFNIAIEYPPYYKSFFIGIPTPAGFFLGVLPLCINYGFNKELPTGLYSIYLIVIGFLMVSNIPTLSTKQLRIQKIFVPVLLGVAGLVIVAMLLQLWKVLSIVGILYILSIIITVIMFIKKRKTYYQNIEQK